MPLHYAAMNGRVAALEELMRQGASAEHAGADACGGFNPLHLAADMGHCGALQALVAAGAALETPSSKGQTPLMLALSKVSCLAPFAGWCTEVVLKPHRHSASIIWWLIAQGHASNKTPTSSCCNQGRNSADM